VRRARWPWVTLALVSLGVIALAGWYAFVVMPQRARAGQHIAMTSGSSPSTVTMTPSTARVPADAASMVAQATAKPVATVSVDGTALPFGSADGRGQAPAVDAAAIVAAVVPVDAVVAPVPTRPVPTPPVPTPAPPTVAPVAPSDALEIASNPAGARVFLDGADQGVTPVKLPGSADHHTLALLLAGHELYTAQVDGHGKLQLELKSVTPHGGPAGIKVITCKDKERYYVFVDGAPTGMTCPTERIHSELGTHTVEVYDMVSESRQKWDINITDTRLSYRVRVEN
jgi:hypothetical protein